MNSKQRSQFDFVTEKTLNQYKLIMTAIEHDFKSHSHPLSIIKQIFEDSFIAEYECLRLEPDKSLLQKQYQELLESFNYFIQLLTRTLITFYQLKMLISQYEKLACVITESNLVNFLHCVLFSSDNLYNLFLKIELKLGQQEQEKLDLQYYLATSLHPETLGLSPVLCLNNVTLQAFNTTLSPPQNEYLSAIHTISLLSVQRSPIHKLKLLLQLAEDIFSEIRQFHDFCGKIFQPEEFAPDDLLTIFLFIILKSKVPDIVAQCNFIEKFLDQKLLTGVTGYYFTTLKACIEMAIEVELQTKNRINNNKFLARKSLFCQKQQSTNFTFGSRKSAVYAVPGSLLLVLTEEEQD